MATTTSEVQNASQSASNGSEVAQKEVNQQVIELSQTGVVNPASLPQPTAEPIIAIKQLEGELEAQQAEAKTLEEFDEEAAIEALFAQQPADELPESAEGVLLAQADTSSESAPAEAGEASAGGSSAGAGAMGAGQIGLLALGAVGIAAAADDSDSSSTPATDTDAGSDAAVNGETFTLTTSVDEFEGTADNDTFTTSFEDLGALDDLDGGDGVDTLRVTDVGGNFEAGTALSGTQTSVERLDIDTSDGVGQDAGQATAGVSEASGAKEVQTITLDTGTVGGGTTAVTGYDITVNGQTYSATGLSGNTTQAAVLGVLDAQITDIFGGAVTVAHTDPISTVGSKADGFVTVTADQKGVDLPLITVSLTDSAEGTTASTSATGPSVQISASGAQSQVDTISIAKSTSTEAKDEYHVVVDGVSVKAFTGNVDTTSDSLAMHTAIESIATTINALVGSDVASASAATDTVTIVGDSGNPLPAIGVVGKTTEGSTPTVPTITHTHVLNAAQATVAASAAVAYDATAFSDEVIVDARDNINIQLADTADATLTTTNGNVTVTGGKDVTVSATGAVDVTGDALTSVSVTGGTGATVDNTDGGSANEGETLTSVTLEKVDGNSTLGGDAINALTLKGVTASANDITINNDTTSREDLTLTADGTGFDASGTAQTQTVVDDNATTIIIDAKAKSDIDVDGTSLTSATVKGSADIDINNIENIATLNITNAGDTKIDSVQSNLATVNGGTATGDINIDATSAASTVSITTGSGDDLINTGTGYTAADTIDGGAGDDVLLSDHTDFEGISSDISADKLSNIETIRTDEKTEAGINLTHFNGVSTLEIAGHDGGGADTFTLASGNTLHLTADIVDGDNNTTVSVGGSGTADLANLKVDAGVDVIGNSSEKLVFSGVETVNLQTATTAGGTKNDFQQGLTVTPSTGGASKVVVTGANEVDFGGTVTAGELDASQSEGALTMTGSMAGASTVKGGSANDTIVGSSAVDTLVGNGGNDTITGGSGADTLKGGAGDDSFVFGATGDLFANNALVDASIDGGAGADAIAIANNGGSLFTIAAADSFAGVTSVEKITAGEATDTAISVTLGDAVFESGINTVDLSSDTTAGGGATIDVSAETGTANGYTLTGSAGVDAITGGAGADVITGGLGADVITGGAGADEIDLTEGSQASDTVNLATGSSDTITSFHEGASNGDILGGLDSIATTTGSGALKAITSAGAEDFGADGIFAVNADTTTAGANMTAAEVEAAVLSGFGNVDANEVAIAVVSADGDADSDTFVYSMTANANGDDIASVELLATLKATDIAELTHDNFDGYGS